MQIVSKEQEILKTRMKFEALISMLEETGERRFDLGQIEESLWKGLLGLGHGLLQAFLAGRGTGDLGPAVDFQGRTLKRLSQLHPRRYVSVFGDLAIQRTVYGSGVCWSRCTRPPMTRSASITRGGTSAPMSCLLCMCWTGFLRSNSKPATIAGSRQTSNSPDCLTVNGWTILISMPSHRFDAGLVARLASLNFLDEGTNVLLLGPPGVGKTALAVGFGHQGPGSRPPDPIRRLSRPGHPLSPCQPLGQGGSAAYHHASTAIADPGRDRLHPLGATRSDIPLRGDRQTV